MISRFNKLLKTTDRRLTRETNVALFVFVVAFLLRSIIRFSFGEEYFWRNSYSLFYELAQSVERGHGLCYQWAGLKCAFRPPVYPVFLALAMRLGNDYVAIVIVQSLVGAASAFCGFLIASELFNPKTGLLAAVAVAIYPYFVMHDTALQETGLFTFLIALSILLLLRSRRSQSRVLWLIAGCSLAVAVLTRATLLVFIPLALLWLLLLAGQRKTSLQRASLVALGFVLVMSPWIVRNYALLGTPAVTTLVGLTLWAGNNPQTFANYPNESIDRSVVRAWQDVPQAEKEAFKQLSEDESAQNRWYIRKALQYIWGHPGLTLANSFRKIGAAFSWKLNPARERSVQAIYFFSYFPVSVLALAGVWLGRKQWKDLSLIYGLFLSFVIVTAVFFSHTSHRAPLDVYLIVLASSAVVPLYETMKGADYRRRFRVRNQA